MKLTTLSKIGLVVVAAGLAWIAGSGADWPGWLITSIGVVLAFGPDLASMYAASVLAAIGTVIENDQGEGDADNTHSNTADVGAIPIFDGQPGGQVVALVNKEGIVSAKVQARGPTTCSVTAGNVVKWGQVVFELSGHGSSGHGYHR